jgi:hypothetical protein
MWYGRQKGYLYFFSSEFYCYNITKKSGFDVYKDTKRRWQEDTKNNTELSPEILTYWGKE